MKDTAVVILNWNGKKFLDQFLGKVIEYSSNARIILADNASTDGSVDYVKAKFTFKLKWMQSSRNLA